MYNTYYIHVNIIVKSKEFSFKHIMIMKPRHYESKGCLMTYGVYYKHSLDNYYLNLFPTSVYCWYYK